jgi:hypothetical protein
MIHIAIGYVASELNAYLNLRSPASTPNRIVPGSLFDLNGIINSKTKDKIVLSIVNVEEERVYRSVDIYSKNNNNPGEQVRPEARVNLYVLFVANLGDYSEALKALAHVISFFQLRNSFDYSIIPDLSKRDGRFVFELYSLTFEQQNHLWGALGAKYMPSVMYKVGIMEIQDLQIEAEVPLVEEININE